MTVEEIRAEREQCADCGGALEEIIVLDRQISSPVNKLRLGDMRLVRWFRAAQGKDTTRNYTAEGTVLTFRCLRCGRIAFYGADF